MTNFGQEEIIYMERKKITITDLKDKKREGRKAGKVDACKGKGREKDSDRRA